MLNNNIIKMQNNSVCKFYMTSGCNKKSCKFIHDPNLCIDFYNGECKYGNKCKFNHKFPSVKKNNRKKNTQSFDPDLTPADLTLKVLVDGETPEVNENDVHLHPNFFKDTEDFCYYNELLKEIKKTGSNNKIWKLWHGDTHYIVDDKRGNWKEKCPTLNKVIDDLSKYFNMKVQATRFNWYKDNTEWKPYHRDRAAIESRIAKIQNFTVAVSFGSTRKVSFQHMKTKSRVDIPLPNGSIYSFAKQINLDWMHGIVQEPEIKKDGRISIILWGWVNQTKL